MSKLILAAFLTAAFAAGPAAAKPKHCPPGLAKKTPACIPPGQAKKGDTARYDDKDRYRDETRRDDDRYDRADAYEILRIGDRVIFEGEEYIVVRTGDRTVLRREDDYYRLPRLDDGSEYVRVGDVILKVDRKTRALFEIIELADLILN